MRDLKENAMRPSDPLNAHHPELRQLVIRIGALRL
jgi:hypothetical protein